MGIIKNLKRDVKNFWNWMPNEIKAYENKEEGIVAFEVNNPPNPYVPEKVIYFKDSKRGILKIYTKKIEDKEKKTVA